MSLLLKLKQKFRTNNELVKSDFYSKLRGTDSLYLDEFVDTLNDSLRISCAVLAVGSSTFSEDYWDMLRDYAKEDPTFELRDYYADIDLLIVPEKRTSLELLNSEMKNCLSINGYKFDKLEHTSMGFSVCNAFTSDDHGNSMKILCTYQHIGYGINSLTTKLKNGTKLDLILGREDIINQTAKKKINEERHKNRYFSLLSGTY